MDQYFVDRSGELAGSCVLCFAEVIPTQAVDHGPFALSPSFVKLYLQELGWTATSSLTSLNGASPVGIQWDQTISVVAKNNNHLRRGYLFLRDEAQKITNWVDDNDKSGSRPPILYLPSENPIDLEPIPCWIVGYTISRLMDQECKASTSSALITEGTLVRISPSLTSPESLQVPPRQHNNYLQQLVGETPCSPLSEDLEAELCHVHSKETRQELALRMSLQMVDPVIIGTTADAFELRKQQQNRRLGMKRAVQRYCQEKKGGQPYGGHQNQMQSSSASTKSNNLPHLMREGALLIHSPNHAAGKTSLVKMIAMKYLKCGIVHVVQPGPLLAKYGIHADSALESILHAIIMSAAALQQSVCVILDQLDAMMPAQLSGRSSVGDAAAPVLNAIASYLKLLALSLKRKREFLFPSHKNPMYNIGGRNGTSISVKLCLVAIVTCPDDGWRSLQKDGSLDAMVNQASILDALPFGRYRLPEPSAESRFRVFQWVLQQEGIHLDSDAQHRLPVLAASAVWCRGRMFRCLARTIRDNLQISNNSLVAMARDIEVAFMSGRRGNSVKAQVSFQAGGEGRGSTLAPGTSDPFSFIGGNDEAKQALEDALALDVVKQQMLTSFGMGSTTGVLLYGPPGTGKTLMAKAVARLLRAQDASKTHFGGAFISLDSSEIVQAEIGTSEKLLVSTFRAARENTPSVIFIDEFQALFTERSGSGSGKLSSTLLQCMDDIKLWRDANCLSRQGDEMLPEQNCSTSDMVLVLGATNTPWMVDKAFLRPGRFDRHVHVGLPSQSERESILRVHAGRMKVLNGDGNVSFGQMCNSIAKQTSGFSGADLSALCRAAAVRCLLESSDYIEEMHFKEELSAGFEPSSSDELVQRNKVWRP